MSHTHAQLLGKNVDELREIAKQLNIKPHPRAKAETLINQIIQQPAAYQAKALDHKAQEPVKAVFNNTPEQVATAVKEHLTKINARFKDDFVIEFPDDGTWVFKCKGAEESGNLSIPMRVIVMKAENVSKGRRALVSAPRDHFDPAVSKGYSNTVLMG